MPITPDTSSAPLVLIVGATGGVGNAVASAFLARGWRVRALTRDRARTLASDGRTVIDWVEGDAMVPGDVVAAAAGASVVFHGANPAQYRRWAERAMPMLESSIAAARAAGARLIFPGSLYNFGPDAGALVDEQSPQHPVTRKGKIRVAMEDRIAAAVRDEGLRALIVRAGDFFGTRSASSWFSTLLVRAGRPLSRVVYPGEREIGHSWAYLPDLARTIVCLAEREAELERLAVYHFGGHWFERGIDLADAIRRAAGMPDAPIWGFPWIVVYLAAPFYEPMREMVEMRYLWRRPIRPDNRKLVALLGEEPHTRLESALVASLDMLDALPASAQKTPINGAALVEADIVR